MKIFPDFRRNPGTRHLVNCFDSLDVVTLLISVETFLELTFCLAGTDYQNRFTVAKSRNDLVVSVINC